MRVKKIPIMKRENNKQEERKTRLDTRSTLAEMRGEKYVEVSKQSWSDT